MPFSSARWIGFNPKYEAIGFSQLHDSLTGGVRDPSTSPIRNSCQTFVNLGAKGFKVPNLALHWSHAHPTKCAVSRKLLLDGKKALWESTQIALMLSERCVDNAPYPGYFASNLFTLTPTHRTALYCHTFPSNFTESWLYKPIMLVDPAKCEHNFLACVNFKGETRRKATWIVARHTCTQWFRMQGRSLELIAALPEPFWPFPCRTCVGVSLISNAWATCKGSNTWLGFRASSFRCFGAMEWPAEKSPDWAHRCRWEYCLIILFFGVIFGK
jgi:hypothetical protein